MSEPRLATEKFPPELSVATIILAAGASRRMGKPKMLLPWGKTSVLGAVIENWRSASAAQICVVLANGSAVERELDRLGFPTHNRIVNPRPDHGMFSSIQAAARWNGWKQSLTHWAIMLGDQPHLGSEIFGRLLRFAAERPLMICQPSRAGRGRHPVVLPNSAFRKLATTEVANLKQFLQSEPVERCEMEDERLDLDLDLPEDYEMAVKRYLS